MSHQPNNIFAGTQVVSLIEGRGPSNSLVHPRGAVGVVTRTPAVVGEKFLVRFPDGFESAFSPEQLEVLKHFKDRLGACSPCSGAVSAPKSAGNSTVTDRRYSDFELKQFIIYRCVVGSHAYGLDNDESDNCWTMKLRFTNQNTNGCAASCKLPTMRAGCLSCRATKQEQC